MTNARRHPVTWRISLIVAGLLCGLVAFVLRAWWLQVVVAEEHLDRGNWRHVTERTVEAPRGTIVDREGRELARSIHAPTLAFDPRYFVLNESNLAETLLAEIGDLDRFDEARFAEWMTAEPADVPRYFVLERRMWPGRAEALLDRLHEAGIRSVYAVPEYRRVYPYRELAAHTLGFVRGDGREGVAGVERVFDEALSGGTVSWSVLRDSDRRSYLLDEAPDVEAARGNTVVLTIDTPLQRVVEDALAETVEHFGAEQGVVVVSRPETGEILSLASWPPFDPNQPGGADDSVWAHPAVSHVFEPGSTAKMLTFAAAANEGLVGWDTPIDCENGRKRIGRYTIRDTHYDEVIPAWQVMQHSSNIGSANLGMQMSQATHRSYLEAFGFGSRTGLGFPGEEPGYIPGGRWPDITHATISYGHGFNLTPLQLNMMTAAIANGGRLMQPRLVREIRDASGEVIERFEPVVRGRPVRPEAAALVTRMLETVVEEDGTGTAAAIEGFSVAGKTGTAELVDRSTGTYHDQYMSSFSGFVPADEPAFAITVMVLRPDPEIGYYGGVVAAPLFARIGEQALLLDGIFPEGELADGLARVDVVDEDEDADADAAPSAAPAPANDPTRGSHVEAVSTGTPVTAPFAGEVGARDTVPDLRGRWVRDAMVEAAARGYRLTVNGTGRVVHQEVTLPVDDGPGRLEVWLEDAAEATDEAL